MSDLTGQWIGVSSHGNLWNHAGIYGLTIRTDGSGEAIFGTVFKSGTGQSYWIYRIKLQVEEHASKLCKIIWVSEPKTLEGDGRLGKTKGLSSNLVLTPQGLVIDRPHMNHFYFENLSSVDQSSTYPLISKIIEKKRDDLIASHPQNSARDWHSVFSAIQLGAGIGAMAEGNRSASQTAFTHANKHAMAGLRGDRFDTIESTQRILETTNALSSHNDDLMRMHNTESFSNPPNKNAKIGGNIGDVPPQMVLIDTNIMSQYIDGMAYDVLVVLPDGNTAGEFCYQYGLSLGNARSLLATSFQATGESTAYGSGNPRSLISWRRYPVSIGQSIQMGIVWKRGSSYCQPFVNKYTQTGPP